MKDRERFGSRLLPDTGKKPEPKSETEAQKKQRYERVLWKKAEELFGERTTLEEKAGKLFDEVKKLKDTKGDQTEIREKSADYWVFMKEIAAIKETEDELQEALVQLGNGVIDKDKFDELLPGASGEPKKLSKRKQHILEERKRMADSGFVFMDTLASGRMVEPTAPPTRHLTTGRRATGIKGSFDPVAAEQIFNTRAADTHGGKTREFGKKSDHYTGKGGRKIRKR